MEIIKVQTTPFDNQKPGTGGLRKQTKVFMQKNFLENFVQASISVRKNNGDKLESWVVGGDGRYPGVLVLPSIIKILVANGIKKVLVVGRELIAPTPAISNVIKKYNADGGFILSASHNPGGENGDFGIKVEMANGGGAPESVTNAIFEETKKISFYNSLNITDEEALKLAEVEYLDPIKDYADLMESMFDFDAIKKWFDAGHTFRFNAMNASTGPTAIEIFVNRLGAKREWILNSVPQPDFGGVHPEPNPTYAKDFYDAMMNGLAEFGCACDGDGDRNMILGDGFYVIPSDCLAIMTKYHKFIPYYANGLSGVARSIPTSSSVDKVAHKMGLDVYNTPTGWKFFASLLDAGKINLCGEESFGQGGDYIREKDGIFAILFWLNILAKTGKSVEELVREMWRENGRIFYSQYSYEGVDKEIANKLWSDMLTANIDGKVYGKYEISKKEVFDYVDPVSHEESKAQGVQIFTKDNIRIFFRLSGTGTVGATLRLYIEKFEDDETKFSMSAREYLKDVYNLVSDILELNKRFGNIEPSAIN